MKGTEFWKKFVATMGRTRKLGKLTVRGVVYGFVQKSNESKDGKDLHVAGLKYRLHFGIEQFYGVILEAICSHFDQEETANLQIRIWDPRITLVKIEATP